MWNTEGKMQGRKVALAEGAYVTEVMPERRKKSKGKLSSTMAMIMGALVTLEIMIAGAMVFNFDFRSADVIALVLGFVVLYSGVVAVLTDK